MTKYAQAVADGKCPVCYRRPPAPDRTRCQPCLTVAARAMAKEHRKRRIQRAAYMRQYMQRRRAPKTDPALVARAKELHAILGQA